MFDRLVALSLRSHSLVLLALVLVLALRPAPRSLDLDVGVPPGSPLEWSPPFLAYVPIFTQPGSQPSAPGTTSSRPERTTA